MERPEIPNHNRGRGMVWTDDYGRIMGVGGWQSEKARIITTEFLDAPRTAWYPLWSKKHENFSPWSPQTSAKIPNSES